MESYIGIVMLFAGSFVPQGWMACDGTQLPINNYQALFSILGTTYGGDGRTNFALPKLDSPIKDGDPHAMQYIICVNGIYPSRQ